MNPQRLDLFTTPVGLYPYTGTTQALDQVRDRIRQNKLLSPTMEFFQWTLAIARDYAHSVGQHQGYLMCWEVWYRTMTQAHDHVLPHDHPGTWAVGTFYLDEGGGPLTLLDPRGNTAGWQWRERTATDGSRHSNCQDWYYTPQARTAIVFPGYVKHLVLPASQPQARTAISWNIHYEQDTGTFDQARLPSNCFIKL